MTEPTYKFEIENGTAREYLGSVYQGTFLVVCVVPTGREALVVLARYAARSQEPCVRVIKVTRYHLLKAICCLAHALARSDWRKAIEAVTEKCTGGAS